MLTNINTVGESPWDIPYRYLAEPYGKELDLTKQLPKTVRVELIQLRSVVD